MNKMRTYFMLFIAGLMGLSACNDELILTAEPKDIPIVYGIISASDTAHYVRIEKAFLDPSTSALELAKIADSLYYTNLDVTIKKVGSTQEYTLDRVDGNFEGYVLEDGVFATSPNVLYKIKASDIPLLKGDIIELRIDRGEGKDLITASTTVVGAPSIQTPAEGAKLDFVPNKDFRSFWLPDNDAAFYDITLFVFIKENSGGGFVSKKLKWRMGRNLSDPSFAVDGVQFLSFMNGQLDPDGSIRILDSINVQVSAAGQELKDFLRVLQANTGITSSQEIPQFSNISEGLGLFTSINRSIITGFELTERSLDSLENSPITKDLNF